MNFWFDYIVTNGLPQDVVVIEGASKLKDDMEMYHSLLKRRY
jgi:hypothetical protein